MRQRVTLSISQVPVLALYAATLIAELPVLMVRWLLALTCTTLLMLLLHHSTSGAQGLAQLVFIPTAWSVLALITPFGGGWWWRQNLGGREPSQREQTAYYDALELLRAHTPVALREPSSWFVLDTPEPDAAVCGSTLMLSRGLLESEYVPAVLAHELGHIASSDGRLTAALNRLVIHPPPKPAERQPANKRPTMVFSDEKIMLTVTLVGLSLWALRRVIGFAKGGGVGLRFTALFWGSYWREREYTADQYAAKLGQAEELADFLEIHALIHDHPAPFIWLTEHTHPPTELRIDKLRNPSDAQQALTPEGMLAPGTPDTGQLTV
jgi:Zn-dependent protease with chaperone function